MTLGTDNFEKCLEKALQEAGLPTDPKQVIGRCYRIGYKRWSHDTVAAGTVTGIELSGEGPGVLLYLSNQRLSGYKLDFIFYTTESGWNVRTSNRLASNSEPEKIEFVLL